MAINRRTFIYTGAGQILSYFIAASALYKLPYLEDNFVQQSSDTDIDWKQIRSMFQLSENYIHMSALLLSSHPQPVRDAIESYRRYLDKDAVIYLERENRKKQGLSRKAAADYLNIRARDIVLTDSTTMGLGIVYQGLQLKAGDEIILAKGDYYSTYESIRLMSLTRGAKMVEIELYDESSKAQTGHLVKTIINAITPATRAIALTWVHSGTGLKLPLKQISEAVYSINAGRANEEHILLIVDGVHGFGVEDFTIQDLGCDIFIAGCHKWLFGPRGTGIVWGNNKAWSRIVPVIPSFIDERAWSAWRKKNPINATNAALMTPGGFKSFEHLWALPEAFHFHLKIGKKAIAQRTHELANALKHGLSETRNITVQTPEEDSLSSGIICFDVKGTDPWTVVKRLRKQGIIASYSPYASRHVRLTPSIYNSRSEVNVALKALRNLT